MSGLRKTGRVFAAASLSHVFPAIAADFAQIRPEISQHEKPRPRYTINAESSAITLAALAIATNANAPAH